MGKTLFIIASSTIFMIGSIYAASLAAEKTITEELNQARAVFADCVQRNSRNDNHVPSACFDNEQQRVLVDPDYTIDTSIKNTADCVASYGEVADAPTPQCATDDGRIFNIVSNPDIQDYAECVEAFGVHATNKLVCHTDDYEVLVSNEASTITSYEDCVIKTNFKSARGTTNSCRPGDARVYFTYTNDSSQYTTFAEKAESAGLTEEEYSGWLVRTQRRISELKASLSDIIEPKRNGGIFGGDSGMLSISIVDWKDSSDPYYAKIKTEIEKLKLEDNVTISSVEHSRAQVYRASDWVKKNIFREQGYDQNSYNYPMDGGGYGLGNWTTVYVPPADIALTPKQIELIKKAKNELGTKIQFVPIDHQRYGWFE